MILIMENKTAEISLDNNYDEIIWYESDCG